MATDSQGDYDLIARIHDWLLSLWTDPEAAAQFAENPAVDLAKNNLDQEALNHVNLRGIAGGVADAPGLPEGGRQVLHSFANSPSSHSSGTREIFHVTREVHHENPVIQKIFQDNSVHVDNSQTLINDGIIFGDVDLDNNAATAIGPGAVAASGDATVNAATGDGAVANQGDGDVNQAANGSQIIDDSEVGQNTSNSAGAVQVGDDANGAVNTGVVDGTQAGGGATGNVNGDDNETATVGAGSGGVEGSSESGQEQGDQGQEQGDESQEQGDGGFGSGAGDQPPSDSSEAPAGQDPQADDDQGSGAQGNGEQGASPAQGSAAQDGGLAFGKGAETPADDAGQDDSAGQAGGGHQRPAEPQHVEEHPAAEPVHQEVHLEPEPVDEVDSHLKPVHAEPDHGADSGDGLDHHVLHA
jgi:hypothetical protein